MNIYVLACTDKIQYSAVVFHIIKPYYLVYNPIRITYARRIRKTTGCFRIIRQMHNSCSIEYFLFYKIGI